MTILQECLTALRAKKRWYLENGYSRHMMGDVNQFFTLEKKDGRSITFSYNRKGRIIGKGKIKITSSTFIEDVLLVKN